MLTSNILATIAFLALASSMFAWAYHILGTLTLGFTLRFLTLPKRVQLAALKIDDSPRQYRKTIIAAYSIHRALYELAAIAALLHVIYTI